MPWDYNSRNYGLLLGFNAEEWQALESMRQASGGVSKADLVRQIVLEHLRMEYLRDPYKKEAEVLLKEVRGDELGMPCCPEMQTVRGG